MPDVSVLGLDALGAAPALTDILLVVDVSDATQAPGGSTKEMTVANARAAILEDASTLAIVGNPISLTGPVQASSSVLTTSPTGGIGYTVGAGGTVTQLTSKSTGVTLNKATGIIAMHNAAMAPGDVVSFTFTNSTLMEDDVLLFNVTNGTAGGYLVNAICLSGVATVQVRNVTGDTLADTVSLLFAIVRGASS